MRRTCLSPFSRSITAAAWILVLFVWCDEGRGGYLWPLQGKIRLNSSFAECRPNHFHAGIDIHARTGTPLRAIDDGYIWHVAVNPFGYGKSLFMKLADGRTVVYAHLDRYVPGIEQVVELEQKRRFSYMVSLYFKKERFPIGKGDMVGYAGSTGAMGAHLHFEIRDTQNRPIDPLTLGYGVKDSTPPVIRSVLLTPLDDTSRVGGQPFPVLMGTGAAGSYQTIRDTIPYYGYIGLSIHVEDYQDEWPFRLNISRSILYVNGTEVFSARYDRFSYAHTREVELEFDYGMYERGMGRFHRLYRYGGNHLLFYEKNGGVLSADPKHEIDEVKVVCYDATGNVSILILYLRGETAPSGRDGSAFHSPYVEGEGISLYRNLFAVSIRCEQGAQPKRSVRAEPLYGDFAHSGAFAVGYYRLEARTSAVCSLEIDCDGQEKLVTFPYGCIERDSTGELASGDGMFRVRIPGGQLYEDLYATIKTVQEEIPGQLKLIRGPYLIEPLQTIFRREVEVYFPHPQTASKRIGIYMLKKEGWIYLGNRYDSRRKSFATTSRHMGTFALMEDASAPEIVDFITEKEGDYIQKLAFIVRDGAGTGFKMSGITLSIDGKAYIPALEPYRDEVGFLLFGRRFTEGGHTASITVTDQAGNRSSRDVSF